MATPLHSRAAVGLRPARSITRRTLGELTAHWAGPSPWSGADRSTAARFYSTTNHARCASIWRAWQSFHMDDPSRRWADIAYTSGVCPHGHRYEGRGVDVRTAANGTTAGNNGSHATCYIAGQGDPLTPQAMAAFADESRRLRGLRKGHRDWKPTECPGDVLYRWVHGGQPVPGTVPRPPATPAPKPAPAPPIEEEDDDMLIIVKGDKSPAWWLSTNLVTKRHARTAQQVAEAVFLTVAAGGKVSTRPGNAPHVLPQSSVDSIPTVGAEGSRDHAIELRVIDVRNELDRITDEVRRFAGEPR